MAITIDAQYRWYLDGELSTEPGVRMALREAKKEHGEKVVCLLAADHAVPHGEVVRLIDLIREEGISKFAINVDPVPRAAEAP